MRKSVLLMPVYQPRVDVEFRREQQIQIESQLGPGETSWKKKRLCICRNYVSVEGACRHSVHSLFLTAPCPFLSSQLSRSSSTLKLPSPVDVFLDLHTTFVVFFPSSSLVLASSSTYCSQCLRLARMADDQVVTRNNLPGTMKSNFTLTFYGNPEWAARFLSKPSFILYSAPAGRSSRWDPEYFLTMRPLHRAPSIMLFNFTYGLIDFR